MDDFTIGTIYKFNYKSDSKPSNKSKALVQLKTDVVFRLIKSLNKNKENILNKTLAQATYAKTLSKVKNKIEEDKLKSLYKNNWNKKESEPEPDQQATHFFYRQYNPDKMEIVDNSKITAVYAGCTYTVNGKEQHKFVNLSPTKIETKYLDKIKDYVKEITNGSSI